MILNGGGVNWSSKEGDCLLKISSRYIIVDDPGRASDEKVKIIFLKIRNNQSPYLPCPYGKASHVTVHDVALTQKAYVEGELLSRYGLLDPWTCGDPSIDVFLASKTLDSSIQEEAENIARIQELEMQNSGDLNNMKVTITSGHNEVMGAILANEPHIYVRIEETNNVIEVSDF